MPDDRSFTRTGAETVFDGHIMTVEVATYRYADGHEERREIVRHKGAIAIVATDSDNIWLVRQPREAVDDPDSLELPAGRLDKQGEDPLDAARRELAEEIAMRSGDWTHLTTYRTSVGFTDELVHVFHADSVTPVDEQPDSGERERIEIVPQPLAELDRLIGEITDSKTLIGLLLLARRRSRS